MPTITDLAQVTEGRLCWPEGRPRTSFRKGAPFRGAQVDNEEREIRYEMERWRIHDYVVSRNRLRMYAGDPGAALWWLDKKKQIRVLSCDRYMAMADNLRAIVKTLDAMRALERWGAYTAEQAAEGARLALPPPVRDEGEEPWWVVLGVQREWPIDAIRAIYRTKAEKAHPDRGGSILAMQRLTQAMDECRKEKGA